MLTNSLQQYFGFSTFREGQESVIQALLDGHSAAAIFATGSGKSLCYQLPALMLPHLTLVVSPLLALIQDQVEFLNQKGIPAASIDSVQTREQSNEIMQGVRNGEIKILMISVERLKNERFRQFIEQVPISLLVVDEAHCISEWGHNFRPDYLKLPHYQKQFSIPQVLLLTATASPKVVEDMQKKFDILPHNITQTGFYRANLNLSVEGVSDKNKYTFLESWLNHEARFQPHFYGDSAVRNKKEKQKQIAATIIYVTLQKTAEQVAQQLCQSGFDAKAYHAGMNNDDRQLIQNKFMQDEVDIIVATIAFGMGIDKANIRHVVHYDLPKSIENYSQEVGRAGRDGQPSDCLVLANRDSLSVLENFIYGDTPEPWSIEYVLNNINQEQQNSLWQCQLYSLSSESNIRQLPLKTLLVYLEMQGLIKPLYSYFAEYKFKLLIDKESLIERFEGERQAFVRAIFDNSKVAKTWWTLDIDQICQQYQLNQVEGRKRIIAALEYFEQNAWLELQNKLATEVYRVNVNEINVGKQTEQISRYFADKEQSEVSRIHNMLALFEQPQCISAQLSEYFGDDYFRQPTNSDTCGHCGVCRGHHAKLPPQPQQETLDVETVKSLSTEFLEQYQQRFNKTPSATSVTRFLCAIGSPEQTKLKARSIKHFGYLEQVSYQDVRTVCEQFC